MTLAPPPARRRYATADVFTDRALGGNPVAAVLDAGGLSARQMQALATEFNDSETTFVPPPRGPAHSARVRIFTPTREVPFAGHPNIGTAFVLAAGMEQRGEPVPHGFTFEEAAGLVTVALMREGGMVVGAEVTAPVPLARDGAFSFCVCTRDAGDADIEARIFMRGLTVEDPATGSATAAVTALLAEVRGVANLALRVGQGVDMGRPSLLVSRARRVDGATTASVGGRCVAMFEGSFILAGDGDAAG